MTYQLANGKTINIPDEQFFKMSDQDLKDLEGTSFGFTTNDPFYDSVLRGTPLEDITEEDLEDLDDPLEGLLDEE